MVQSVVIVKSSNFDVKVSRQGDAISALRPITVRNQINEIRSIEDIPGVNTSVRVDGATLVYNANTDEYDVKLTGAGIAGFTYASGNNTLIITGATGTLYHASIGSLTDITLAGNTSIDSTLNILLDEGEF
jgi:hypothetical protein